MILQTPIIINLTEYQQRKLLAIRERWLKFEYGLGQTDYDIRFFLNLLLEKNWKEITDGDKDI